MKRIGQVKEYNGYYGTIVNEHGEEYLLLKEQVIDEEVLQINDNVTFVPEQYENSEVKEKIARLVRKIPKKF